MTDWNSMDPNQVAEDAWATLEKEKQKLAELGKHWDEATTTVRAKDQSLEMKFDGRGELTDLTFNTSKYRSMAPAELASVIVETLRKGRAESQQKVSELMGTAAVPGLDLDGLTSGKVRPDEMINSLMGPMLETLSGFGLDIQPPKPENHKREARENG
ncbi:YbaB/EbfC family nucleoid-associated protein [Amycolatopsis sp. NPDC059021]|uniref:YbaB/EbfC family nucleoid-associated protein n=1 Tax=Amycolatopsis sp. NPDC059021 TaxID=3346704 RepID=UPI00366F87C4